MATDITRREALATLALTGTALTLGARAADEPQFRIATFSSDVTPAVGHPLLGSRFKPAERIDDPLAAHGVVLLGGEMPVVIVAIDWCEIRGTAHDRWRAVNGPHLVALVRAGALFVNGKLVERPDDHHQPEAA